MGFFRPSPEQLAKRAEKRAKRLASQRANIRALAEREFLRSRINLGAIKLDERQTLYLAMIFQELATMNDRAAAAAGETNDTDIELDEKLEAEIEKLG
jgi:two-component sensor histidine kinase